MSEKVGRSGQVQRDGPPTVLPFSGVRVLSFAQLAQGPAAVQLLADLGADVIKIERPGVGSLERQFRLRNGHSLLFEMLQRNVRSVTVNLKSEAGRSLVLRLLEATDVLVENFRPGVMARLGLDYESLSTDFPKLIYASSSGYGSSGPYVGHPGQDLLIQALSGLATATGRSIDPPTPAGAPVIDFHAAAVLAFSISAALLQREKTGRGQRVETSLLEAAIHLQMENIFDAANGHVFPRSRSGVATPGAQAPYGLYRATDGWIAISDVGLEELADALESEDLLELGGDDRFAARDAIRERVMRIIATRSVNEWLSHFRSRDIWCSRVQDYVELLSDPQVLHLEMLYSLDGAPGTTRQLRSPVNLSDAPPEAQPRRSPPTVGAHTDEVLKELLGLSDGRLSELRTAGDI